MMRLSVVLTLMYAPVPQMSHPINPEKLHKSHLIVHIHDAVFPFFLSMSLVHATELWDVVE